MIQDIFLTMGAGDIAAWAALGLSIYSTYKGHKAESESQSQIRTCTQILDIKNDVSKLQELAFRYWLSEDHGSSPAALEIKILLKNIPAKAQKNKKLYTSISADLSALRQLISGGDFEVVNRPPLLSSSPRLNRMANKFSDIFQKIECM